VRGDEKNMFLFVMNFAPEVRRVDLGAPGWTDAVTGAAVAGRVEMPAYGVRVLRRAAGG
jgi:beta-galactosidase